MFMDKVKVIAEKNKPKVNLEYYRIKVKIHLLLNAFRGRDYCRVWLPEALDLDDFNILLKEDNIECYLLQSNLRNTKYKVYVSERIDPEKFRKQVEYNRNHRKQED